MFCRFLLPIVLVCSFVTNALAMNSDNPFGKTMTINIGTDIDWEIDNDARLATKSVGDGKGAYYHLQYDNEKLSLFVSTDSNGLKPKKFNQLEVMDVQIDGKQSPLFKWCLANQERHDRFLQQGLIVRKNVCLVNGDFGRFEMQISRDFLRSLQNGKSLLIVLKPFRTPLRLNYDIRDFKDVHLALNSKPEPPVPAVTETTVVEKPVKKPKKAKPCWVNPPASYKKIKPMPYNCDDTAQKKKAEKNMAWLVKQEKEKAAEAEKQRKLAEQKKQKELEEKLKREQALKAEAAAIAASMEKQAELGSEVAKKMVEVCEKFWKNGEHRCYCQKYIEYAPAEIQARSDCE